MDLLFGCLLFLLPTQLGRHFWPSDAYIFSLKIDYLSPTLFFTDLLILVLIFLNRPLFKIKLYHFGLIFLAVLNILWADRPLIAFFSWLRIMEFFCLSFVFVRHSRRLWSLWEKIVPCLLFFLSLLSLCQFIRQTSVGGPFWLLGERTFSVSTPGIARAVWLDQTILRPYATFSHPNSLAGFVLICLIFLFGKSKKRLWDRLAIFFGLSLMILTFSRTVWLAAFLGGFIYFVFRLKNSPRFDFQYLLLSLFLPFSIFLFTKTNIEVTSFSRRSELLRQSLRIISSSPFLGVGAGNFVVRLSQNQLVTTWLYWLQPVHNIFLLIASEFGLPMLIVFILFLFLTIRKCLLATNYLLLATLLAILFTGLFDHYWLTLRQNQLLFLLVVSFAWGINGKIEA